MKPVHFSAVALVAALSALATGIVTQDSGVTATAIIAVVSCFLPAVQYVLPWFEPPTK